MNHLLSRLAAINLDPSGNGTNIKVPKGELTQTTVGNVLHLVFGLAGAIALIIITVAGLQYVLSQGNPQSAAKAKDTIIYALVGLIICAIGYGIVSFVVRGLGL